MLKLAVGIVCGWYLRNICADLVRLLELDSGHPEFQGPR